MKDQVASFETKGISAVHLAGNVSQEVQMGVVSGNYRLVFLSPEQLLTMKKWRIMLQSQVYREQLVAFVLKVVSIVFVTLAALSFAYLGYIHTVYIEVLHVMSSKGLNL